MQNSLLSVPWLHYKIFIISTFFHKMNLVSRVFYVNHVKIHGQNFRGLSMRLFPPLFAPLSEGEPPQHPPTRSARRQPYRRHRRGTSSPHFRSLMPFAILVWAVVRWRQEDLFLFIPCIIHLMNLHLTYPHIQGPRNTNYFLLCFKPTSSWIQDKSLIALTLHCFHIHA